VKVAAAIKKMAAAVKKMAAASSHESHLQLLAFTAADANSRQSHSPLSILFVGFSHTFVSALD